MELSRRNFLKGAGVAAGAAAIAGLAGCSSEESSNGTSGETSSGSTTESSSDSTETAHGYGDWLGTAPDVTVDDCVETYECDVLVVGSAQAGVHAAYAAIQEGADVIMIERNSCPHISGAVIGYFNSDYMRGLGYPDLDPEVVTRMFVQECQYRVDNSLVALWAYHVGEIFDETIENVLGPADFESWSEPYNICEHSEGDYEQYLPTSMRMDNSGNDSLEKFITTFHDWILDHGGRIDFYTCGRKLVQDEDGAVTGVIATNEDGDYVYYKTNKGVVMCTGPYEGDLSMVDYFCYPKLATWIKKYAQYNGRTSDTATVDIDEPMDDGTGNKMMCWAGGMMEQTDPAYQSGSISDGRFGGSTLEIDCNGRRFRNEGMTGMIETYYVFDLPDQDVVYQIVSKDDFPWPARFNLIPQDPEEVWEKAEAEEHWEADTLEELAEQIGVDPDALVETVNRYNELCYQENDEDFGKPAKHLDPIDKAPYYAFKKHYSFFCLLSGVKVNRYLQVIDEDWHRIPGLYAAGNCVGYRQGSSYSNQCHGISNALALTHGYFAGQHCARGDGEPA